MQKRRVAAAMAGAGGRQIALGNRRGGHRSAYQGEVHPEIPRRLFELVRAARLVPRPVPAGPPGALVPDTTFDSLDTVEDGRSDGVVFNSNEVPPHYREPFRMLETLIYQVSAGQAGYERTALPAGTVGNARPVG